MSANGRKFGSEGYDVDEAIRGYCCDLFYDGCGVYSTVAGVPERKQEKDTGVLEATYEANLRRCR